MTADDASESTVVRNAAPLEPRVRAIRGDGIHWRVAEREFPLPDRRTGRFLIFESEEVVRRVRNYPLDWYSWDDGDLYALSLGQTK